jgi:Phycobilisome degradation protein nblA
MDTNSFQLTLEQEFQMRLMEESAHTMTREQMIETLLQAARLLMVKDNVLRDTIKHCLLSS